MRFQIEAHPVGPLAILDSLPKSNLAILEGLNGIGKTLAVRLLQLCTGVMPYRPDALAWRSLCEGVGTFKVSVTELRDGRSIRWTADTRTWLHKGPTAPQSDWFSAIEVDGQAADLQTVRRLLAVHRIAGDEGLVETLAEEVDGYADSVRRWFHRIFEEPASPVPLLEAAVGQLIDQLDIWTADRFETVRLTAVQARAGLASARKALNEALARRDTVLAAFKIQERLLSIQAELPGLEEEARALDQEIAGLQDQKSRLDDQITRLVTREATAKPLRDELQKARTTLEKNEKKLAGALGQAATSARRLQVQPRKNDVEAAIKGVDREIDKLRESQVEMHAAPTMRQTLDDVSERLVEAERKGLPDQIAYNDPITHTTLSVEQMHVGVAYRRQQLEGLPPPPEVKELSRRIIEATARRQDLLGLGGTLDDVERLRNLIERNENRVSTALASIPGDSARDLQTVESQRRAVEERLVSLGARRVALRDQIGGRDPATAPTLESQLKQILSKLDLRVDDLQPALDPAERDVVRAEENLSRARAASNDAERELSRGEAAVQRSWDLLAKGSLHAWLGELLKIRDETSPSLSVRLSVLSRVDAVLERVLERLGRYRDQLAAIDSGLGAVGNHLRGKDPQATEYVDELQIWLGREFSAWFNQPILRQELFPNADGQIELSVENREVYWSERNAPAGRSRPLEAFSSGEQAFAYTRARLAMLDEEQPAENRLIALDEFGAFIAHDRLTQLLKYLRDRARDYPDDQVVVILPLSRDYEQQSQSIFGGEQELLEELAQQIKERRYAVRELA